MTEPDYITAHKHSSKHRADIEASELCGCFYCLRIFQPSEIVLWVDDGATVLCPYCEIDSVLGEKSGYSITVEFLQKMKKHWFGDG